MEVEAKQGVNKNKVVDNLDDLDKEFCKTFDELLALYKRIMIRAYDIKELAEGYNELKKKLPKQYDSIKEYIDKTF